jgi:hypothetical protein
MSKENVKIGGNITEFDKNYVASVLQMGVPILDVDWNNMQDLLQNTQRKTLELIGGSKEFAFNDAFKIEKVSETVARVKAGTILYKGWMYTLFEDKTFSRKIYNCSSGAVDGGSIDWVDEDVYIKFELRYVDYTEDPNLKHPLLEIMRCARLQLTAIIYFADAPEDDIELVADENGYWDMKYSAKLASVSGGVVTDEREWYDANTGFIPQIFTNKANMTSHVAKQVDPTDNNTTRDKHVANNDLRKLEEIAIAAMVI